ncbi:methyl-accepting chemotaxis protein [Rhizobium sp. S-51]|uniref:Methyl-accepting chemotaxis protein n=1 Tax=Rhizobium terricola TaxID=2728849 RepID=A0A7Y0ASC3_9HYPH|nr:methyl-accepting chemotaxis protein [Rhizobium terricola]NML72548.1 methyl-accepting chemotaxis protein [Rhizobium terricola]
MRFNISFMVTSAGLALAAGLVATVGIGMQTLQTLKINGPIYHEIVDGKDLIADILPPPLYLTEAYSLTSETALHPDTAQANLARLEVLKGLYAERREYWKNSTLPAELSSKLYSDVLTKGDIFWNEVNNAYIPAASKGNATAVAASLPALKESFHTHEKAVNELVDMSNAYLKTREDYAAGQTAMMEMLALAGGSALILMALGAVFFIRQRALNPLGGISSFMTDMAGGEYDRAVPYSNRKDEIGDIANAVEVFRLAGLEKQRLEAQATHARALTESERAAREERRVKEAESLQMVVEALGAGLNRLAECNIRLTIDEPFEPHFEPLRRDFNNSIATFQATLEQVLDETRSLYDNGQEMRAAADNLSQRTEQQAAALEETSAALEQVTATVRSSAERTLDTRNLVRDAKECAASSGEVVRDAISAMQRIEKASSEISQIISVIDEIAFQTNLLALNAGVEAARAGEAGKGFAVVAQEVRELAQRSATAAREIKGLIVNSTVEVASGVKLVGETGQALDQIQGFVARVDSNIDAIATAAREQSVGLQEISSAINNIDQMTQQNAAMVEETTAISHTLAEGAAHLTTLVGRFKLNRRTSIRSGEPDQQIASGRAA